MRIALGFDATPAVEFLNGTLDRGEPRTSITKLWRVEDVISVVAETIGLQAQSSFVSMISIQISQIQAYAILDSITDPFAMPLNATWYDPENAVEIKRDAAIGDIDDPPRVGLHYPITVSDHMYNWDFTPGTSAPLVNVETTEKCYISGYFDIVVSISKQF